ncbi:filamentous hemagglutinin N-terminal domain-containing protein [Leptolyngbyaceae cyanobacterium CCMR0082]|uniref:Filamentous hemagglutinin N-terminal domain-containing protein n=1 Tax=Adonisia turfae CCMR0082 TaxID=2304604 RepID=A0A6M0SIA8_9CYAN|nr:filamentous hemagglutinin N-terminal domain-containing protein [Adonisia turfae]NEZ68084.1 filamentous hemagglutinin N-terminal domain-containing protein [Adonisia turfae CCMR0082]
MSSPQLYWSCLLAAVAALWSEPIQAQLIPDQTLGAEGSVVSTDVLVKGSLADLIEGGAARGPNLFHSFDAFTVANDQRVYFANPAEIESILSRVTGNNRSDIFGTLGVDGNADLFLINPNGIVFGPDVSLDVTGSFYATTAAAVDVGDGVFSAVMPGQSQLLAVSPSVLFWNHLTDNSGDITNRGQVTAGADLVLAGQNLDLAAQVAGVGDVSLLATDIVKIRDTADNPFIALAGGDLLVQGNQQVDIVALTHPDSQLFSHGNMVLRSPAPVNGDAYFFSGGNFRIENLDNTPGNLNSPVDPIIRSLGDVEFDNYFGSSLHILAGGSVTFTIALITAPDPGIAGVDFLQETIELSDGTIVEVDGSAQPTIDIRAGVSPEAVGVIPAENPSGQGFLDLFVDSFFLPLTPSITAKPSSADIEIGSILINQPNGIILLTNQYEPNMSLSGGDVQVIGNDLTGSGLRKLGINITAPDNGSIFLDSRNDITVTDTDITILGSRSTGDIVLVADENVILENSGGFVLSGIFNRIDVGGQGTTGDIRISAKNLSVLNGAQIDSRLLGNGETSDIILDIEDTVLFDGIDPLTNATSGVFSSVQRNSQGQAGDIYIEAGNFELLNGATLRSSTFGIGDAGNITLNIRDTARFDSDDPVNNFSGVLADVQPNAQGQAGNVFVETTELEVLGGTVLSASNFGGVGNAGNVILDIRETARFDQASQATSEYASNAPGRGGNVMLSATNLDVLNGAVLSTNTFGNGDAGDVILDVRETVRFDGRDPDPIGRNSGATSNISVSNASNLVGMGNGGNVRINAGSLEVLNGAEISADVDGIGNGGDVVLDIRGTARIAGSSPLTGVASGVSSAITTGGQGQAGNVELKVTNLELLDGAQISSGTQGIGDAGDVILAVRETARIEGFENRRGPFGTGIFSSVDDTGRGQGGNIRLDANNLILNGAQIVSGIRGRGDGGDITLNVRDTLRLENNDPATNARSGIFSNSISTAVGSSGDIRVISDKLEIFDSLIRASSEGNGNAGDIFIIVQDDIQARNGSITADSAFNAGGQIQISSSNIFLFENSDIQTFVNSGADDGGDIEIIADALVAFDDSDILAFAADGRGGDIDLSRTAFFGEDLQFAQPGTDPITLDGNGRVDINATGGIASGTISLADVSFIENSITELPDELVNPETLVAASCIAQSSDIGSSVVFTGNDSLPQQPGSAQITYSLSTVQPITKTATNSTSIAEPQNLYRLADGRLVISRDCHD